MYPKEQYAMNTGISGIGQLASSQISNQAVERTEIDAEVNHMACNLDALEGGLNDLTSALYAVLGADQKATAGNAPTPVMNSPLGASLHSHNARLVAVVRAMNDLRGRVQL